MVISKTVKIVNDTKTTIDFYLDHSNKPKYLNLKKDTTYVVQANMAEIVIRRTDMWKDTDTINSIFLFIYACDIVLGNVLDTRNLPYSIDYSLPIKKIKKTR